MDTMQGLKRTHYCGDVEGIGNEVVVGGYVQKVRDLGNLIFSGLSGKYKELYDVQSQYYKGDAVEVEA